MAAAQFFSPREPTGRVGHSRARRLPLCPRPGPAPLHGSGGWLRAPTLACLMGLTVSGRSWQPRHRSKAGKGIYRPQATFPERRRRRTPAAAPGFSTPTAPGEGSAPGLAVRFSRYGRSASKARQPIYTPCSDGPGWVFRTQMQRELWGYEGRASCLERRPRRDRDRGRPRRCRG